MPGPQDPQRRRGRSLFGTPQGVSGQQILQQGEADAKMIDRERPDPPPPRKALVNAWVAEVKHAKKHWKPAFDRMREDQDFCLGKQWSKNPKDKRYVANITLREVTQRVSLPLRPQPEGGRQAPRDDPQHRLGRHRAEPAGDPAGRRRWRCRAALCRRDHGRAAGALPARRRA